MSGPFRMLAEISSILFAPAALLACVFLQIDFSAVLLFLAVAIALGMFFISWESSKPSLRQVMPVAVLSALAAAGRLIFAAIPSVQPVTAICVISGMVFGRREGFVIGALSAFVSNCFLGQGMWTLWQMYAWGMVGYLSGVVFCRARMPMHPAETGNSPETSDFPEGSVSSKECDYQEASDSSKECDYPEAADSSAVRNPSCGCPRTLMLKGPLGKIGLCAFGFLASFLFSLVMNTWTAVGFSHGLGAATILAIYASGFAFDMAHAISTAIFLALLSPSWERRLIRIKNKYALGM